MAGRNKWADIRLKDDTPARRARISDRTQEIVAEVAALREIREALGINQSDLAERMEVAQPAISKIEGRSDMKLSTLRNYIEALGGRLELTFQMPGRTVTMRDFGDTKSTVAGAAPSP